MLLDSFIYSAKTHNIKTDEIIIVKKLSEKENKIIGYVTRLSQANANELAEFSQNNYEIYQSLKDTVLKDAIVTLGKEFMQSHPIDADKFKLHCKITILSGQKIGQYFKHKRRTADESWEAFYSDHPGAQGFFEFSKVIYRGKYACFYAARHSNSYSATGDIIILRFDGKWQIISYLNIWKV